MRLLPTYRTRLVLFILLLVAFLGLTLLLSFQYSRDIMINEAVSHLGRTSRLLDTALVTERKELERYSEIVRKELRIKEYMYVVVEIGTDTAPLNERYTEQFSWLPVDSSMIISHKGEVLSGEGPAELLHLLQHDKSPERTPAQYIQTSRGIELVTSAPIHYQNRLLGHIVMSRIYSLSKLHSLEKQSNGRIFLTRGNNIILSTLPDAVGMQATPANNRLQIGTDIYMLQNISVPHNNDQEIGFYFGVSELELLNNIDEYSHLTLLTVAFGVFVILLLGLLFLRDFNRPMKKLLDITARISKGELPRLHKVTPRNEMDILFNQFTEMLQGLRDKQRVIEETQAKLEALAITDTLTSLYNRRYLLDIFPKLQAQAKRDHSTLSVIMIDLDHFKRINDKYGHPAGDQCLMEFSAAMRNQSRQNDYLFRMGGEEFLILTLGEGRQGMLALAEKVRLAIEKVFVYYEGKRIHMTISCGISTLDPEDDHRGALNMLLKRADNALYEAKQNGRNQTVLLANEEPADRLKSVD